MDEEFLLMLLYKMKKLNTVRDTTQMVYVDSDKLDKKYKEEPLKKKGGRKRGK